jgi:hypothetical protein
MPTKQELFKLADSTFQRGNRALARRYLTEYLAGCPTDEAAWMLMARITEDSREKAVCFERVLKLRPDHSEAKIGLVRARASISPTLPRGGDPPASPWTDAGKSGGRNILRGALLVGLIVLLSGTSTFVIARNNPDSVVAQVLAVATPTFLSDPSLAEGIALQTRAEIEAKYPQYSALVDALIGLAVENANNGMEGAPERPGAEIMVSEQSAMEAVTLLTGALPQPGSLSSLTITEQQATSWLAMELKEQPDLPVSDVQVYLRNGKVQVWGMVNGSESATSALIVGTLEIDGEKQPYLTVESMQIGKQTLPGFLLSQIEAWINQSLAESIRENLPGLELVNVKIANGLVTLSGTR